MNMRWSMRGCVIEPRWMSRGVFTLVELLVVIAIISILFTILLPALSTAKGRAHQISCSGNIKQMSYAIQGYALDYNDYLLPERSPGPTVLAYYWQGKMLPYMSNTNVFICQAGREQIDKTYLSTGSNYLYNSRAGDSSYTYDPEYDYKRMAQIKKPSQKIILLDGKDCAANYNFFDLGYPSSADVLKYCDLRHSNGTNLLWLDCHVTKENPVTEMYFVPYPKWVYWSYFTK